MKNSSNNNTLDQNIRISNAVVDAIQDHSDSVKEESFAILAYIAKGYDNNIPLSLHIKGSVNTLGFKIHPDTYLSVTNTLLEHMGPDFYYQLQYCDDLQLYNYEGNKPVLELTCKQKYMSVYENMNALKPSSESSSESLESPNSSDSEDQYINLPQSSSDSASRSSTSSSHSQPTFDSEDLNHISSILLYTVATFLVIQGIAWYVRKYHPNTLAKDSDIENNENVLYSINEDFYTFPFTDYFFKFIFLFVPVSFVIMYKLRYYYFYRITMFFKKN